MPSQASLRAEESTVLSAATVSLPEQLLTGAPPARTCLLLTSLPQASPVALRWGKIVEPPFPNLIILDGRVEGEEQIILSVFSDSARTLSLAWAQFILRDILPTNNLTEGEISSRTTTALPCAAGTLRLRTVQGSPPGKIDFHRAAQDGCLNRPCAL